MAKKPAPAPANETPAASGPPDAAPNPKLEPPFSAAKQLYAEQFGDAIVTNSYLRIVIVCLVGVILSLLYTQCLAISTVRNFKPLIVRIDGIGRADVVRYRDWEYTPQDSEVKYFLGEFCRLYYSRNRDALEGNFAVALQYLSPDIRDKVDRAWKLNQTVDNYRRSAAGDIDIQITQVVIDDLRKAPYRAKVDFDQIFYGARERIEARRVKYTANFVFHFQGGNVPEPVLRVNPLAMQIDYFREDIAVTATPTPILLR